MPKHDPAADGDAVRNTLHVLLLLLLYCGNGVSRTCPPWGVEGHPTRTGRPAITTAVVNSLFWALAHWSMGCLRLLVPSLPP
jgi:hypothetical protein